MGEWRNGGNGRKTIALGIDVTIREDSLEGMHARQGKSNQVHCCINSGFAWLLLALQLDCSPRTNALSRILRQ